MVAARVDFFLEVVGAWVISVWFDGDLTLLYQNNVLGNLKLGDGWWRVGVVVMVPLYGQARWLLRGGAVASRVMPSGSSQTESYNFIWSLNSYLFNPCFCFSIVGIINNIMPTVASVIIITKLLSSCRHPSQKRCNVLLHACTQVRRLGYLFRHAVSLAVPYHQWG